MNGCNSTENVLKFCENWLGFMKNVYGSAGKKDGLLSFYEK